MKCRHVVSVERFFLKGFHRELKICRIFFENLLLTALSSIYARDEITKQEPIIIECTFYLTIYNEYVCRLRGIEVTDEVANVTITGEHRANRTNADVNMIEIWNSNTPFIIKELATTFPNAYLWDIDSSGVRSIQLPRAPRLRFLYVNNNDIPNIGEGAFAKNPQLFSIDVSDNNINTLDPNAFDGLINLFSIDLSTNNISSVDPRTFNGMSSLSVVNLNSNQLVRIENLFSSNLKMWNILLQDNQIEAISPSILTHLRNGEIIFVNLRGNKCANFGVMPRTESSWMEMNNLMQPCFNAYTNPPAGAPRRVMFEFYGELELYDRNGNLLAKF